jgi:hypothetical protein
MHTYCYKLPLSFHVAHQDVAAGTTCTASVAGRVQNMTASRTRFVLGIVRGSGLQDDCRAALLPCYFVITADGSGSAQQYRMPTSPVQIPIPSRPGSAPPTMADGDAADHADDRVSASARDACYVQHPCSRTSTHVWLAQVSVHMLLVSACCCCLASVLLKGKTAAQGAVYGFPHHACCCLPRLM